MLSLTVLCLFGEFEVSKTLNNVGDQVYWTQMWNCIMRFSLNQTIINETD